MVECAFVLPCPSRPVPPAPFGSIYTQVCFDNEINCAFIPCGHYCCCVECASRSHECPVCRTVVTQTVRIFRP
ncbi:unnamed protein product [Ectocarpus sp. 13 AM-2016]